MLLYKRVMCRRKQEVPPDTLRCYLQHGCPLEMRGAHLTVPAQVRLSRVSAVMWFSYSMKDA